MKLLKKGIRILHFDEGVQKGSGFPEWGVSDDPSLFTMMMADLVYLVEPGGARIVKDRSGEFNKKLTEEETAIAILTYKDIT